MLGKSVDRDRAGPEARPRHPPGQDRGGTRPPSSSSRTIRRPRKNSTWPRRRSRTKIGSPRWPWPTTVDWRRSFESSSRREARSPGEGPGENAKLVELQREKGKLELKSELDSVYKTPQGELSKKYSISLYAAIAGWAVAVLASLGLVVDVALEDPRKTRCLREPARSRSRSRGKARTAPLVRGASSSDSLRYCVRSSWSRSSAESPVLPRFGAPGSRRPKVRSPIDRRTGSRCRPRAPGPSGSMRPASRSGSSAGLGAWRCPALILLTGLSARIRAFAAGRGRPWLVEVRLYAVLFLAVEFLLNLPFRYYAGFVRPHEYGLSVQPVGRWLGDALKGLASRWSARSCSSGFPTGSWPGALDDGGSSWACSPCPSPASRP